MSAPTPKPTTSSTDKPATLKRAKTQRRCEVCDTNCPHRRAFGGALGTIWCCTACGTAQTEQHHAKQAESTYDSSYFDGSDRYLEREAELQEHFSLLLDLIARRRSPGRLLDVGCGTGQLLCVARSHGHEVHGIEYSAFASGFARDHNGLDVVTGTVAEGSPSLHGPFDVITINHVLEHLPNPRADLRILRDLLAPGGLLVVGVPNYASAFRVALRYRWPSLLPSEHLWHFTPSGLTSLLHQSGLPKVEVLSGDNHAYEMKLPAHLRVAWKVLDRLTSATVRTDSIVAFASLI